MTRAVCPGSFDPVTHGHLDIIQRTTRLADQVIVAVGDNMAKNGLFTPQERVAMLEAACAEWDNVSVTLFKGLLVDFCTANDVGLISKGVRAADFAYEVQMAQMNRRLTGVDTILLPTDPQWAFVSSSLVREVATLGGDVSGFLPPAVAEQAAARVSAQLVED
ncbi:MAG TPA: pantetheine-phosphate adenylyltransferase [Propionibacteriaceae bacterium]|jgi:pantetheine-phosphate adenylyltransferase|nr:pantetheine-phosphate adenylyltransferase [Propionibacteriaceae bacterium]